VECCPEVGLRETSTIRVARQRQAKIATDNSPYRSAKPRQLRLCGASDLNPLLRLSRFSLIDVEATSTRTLMHEAVVAPVDAPISGKCGLEPLETWTYNLILGGKPCLKFLDSHRKAVSWFGVASLRVAPSAVGNDAMTQQQPFISFLPRKSPRSLGMNSGHIDVKNIHPNA
jgi:hypothetical protein